MEKVRAPNQLGFKTAIGFVKRLDELPEATGYLLDFSHLNFVHPFGMVYVAEAIRRLRSRLPNCEIECDTTQLGAACSYAAHVGFFRWCGFSIGNAHSFKPNSQTYIPITNVPINHVNTREAIEEISLELARQLSQQPRGALVDVLEYSFREIIRNVVEHSESPDFTYCAQYWPGRPLVELVILDRGIGLRQSLARNPHLKLQDDKDALKYALMPGISGKTYQGVKLRHKDPWQNSGYGLYMNYRMCNEGGTFFVASGSSGLLRRSEQTNNYLPTQHNGTVLRLELDPTKLHNVTALLEAFAHQGEIHALRVGLGAIPTASSMSKMLKDNFKVDYQVEIGDTVRHAKFGEGTVFDKVLTIQGEMLWVEFKGGRRKKVLSADVALINEDTYTYTSEGIDDIPDANWDDVVDPEYPVDFGEHQDFDF